MIYLRSFQVFGWGDGSFYEVYLCLPSYTSIDNSPNLSIEEKSTISFCSKDSVPLDIVTLVRLWK